MFSVIMGLISMILGAIGLGQSAQQMNKQEQDEKLTAEAKAKIREKALEITKKIMKNGEARSKLMETYQTKGAAVARAYLMQSPFGANIKTLGESMKKIISEYKTADKALAKEEQDNALKQDHLDRLNNDLTGSGASANNITQEFDKNNWDASSSTSDAIVNHLSNENKPLQPKPTTTAPTQQVMGGLKGAQ